VQGDAATARAATARARETVDGATRRERQHVEAVSAFIAGETARGLALVDEHVAEFPRDAMLVNQASGAIALAGRSDREEHRVAFLERLAPAYGDDWWFQSALAFTYHEVDRFEESRRLSQASLDQYPRNASAAHNLAHISFETLDIEAGSAFLDDWMTGYDRRAHFHCHLAWHQAMFALHEGRYAEVLALFERDILPASNPRSTMTAPRCSGACASMRRARPRCRGGRSRTSRGASRGPATSSASVTPRWPTRPAATRRRSRS
jgi:predicted Zn-dependent protease